MFRAGDNKSSKSTKPSFSLFMIKPIAFVSGTNEIIMW